jgi:hypothetical protein
MEIYQNSILKLIVRQGTDLERKSVVLTSGELGYTTDTNRLYIGNSVLSGGKVVGNISHTTNTTIQGNYPTAVVGDYAYSSDESKLYRCKSSSNVTDLSSWEVVGGVYTSNDNHIVISTDNKITLAKLSANAVDNDLVKGPIILDSGKIALSSKIPFQAVSTNTITFSTGLSATSNGVSILNQAINPLSSTNIVVSVAASLLSANAVSPDLVKFPIILDSGRITLSSTIPITYIESTKFLTVSSGLISRINGGINTGTPMSVMNSNITLETNQILALYDGATQTLSCSRNLSSTPVQYLSTGRYRFLFEPLNTSNLYPNVNIIGDISSNYMYNARILSFTNSSCDVIVYNQTDGNTNLDIPISLIISY